MVKYILKRIGLAIVILLGVSIIIYTLVRLMPTDYLETKFHSQLQQGTMTRAKLNEFRQKYGLFMPESYVDVKVSDVPGVRGEVTFVGNSSDRDYEDAQNELLSVEEWYVKQINEFDATINGITYMLILKESGEYEISLRETVKDEETGKNEEKKTILKSGYFVINELDENGVYNITLDFDIITNGEFCAVSYRHSNFGDKLGAVLGGYFKWLGNALKFDLGESFDHQLPVTQVIAENMWISFALSFVAMILEFAIAIPLGIVSATHQYSAADYIVTVITLMGISLPSFFFAALLIKLFATTLGWFPASGLVSGGSSAVNVWQNLPDMLWHLVLPMTVLVVLSIGGMMRYTRTNMLEVLNSDYIRTARAKGLSEKRVVYVHAFRNTMIPLMTLMAGILPSLFGGAMITEEVFSIDGIGRLAYKALRNGDIPFIMGYNMFLAILTVIGTLLSDIMYAVVDPRVKLTK